MNPLQTTRVPAGVGERNRPDMSEEVAKRILDQCLSEWKRHAVKFQHENAGVAQEPIRKRLKWYTPLVRFPARAYFDYWDSMDLARLWDSMAVGDRAEWIITQLRDSADRPESIQDVLRHFDVGQGSTYSVVVAELAKDVERSSTNGEVLMDKSA
jgi:hypothetical protein